MVAGECLPGAAADKSLSPGMRQPADRHQPDRGPCLRVVRGVTSIGCGIVGLRSGGEGARLFLPLCG